MARTKAGKAAPGLVRHGLPKVSATGERPGTFRLHQRKPQIIAELIRSDTCAVLGIVAHGNTPVLALCRRLIDFGYDTDHRLEAFREATLCRQSAASAKRRPTKFARVVITNERVVGVGDTLFEDGTSQTWRFVKD